MELQEKEKHLEELLRIAYAQVMTPVNYDDEIQKLGDTEYRLKHAQENPQCYIALRMKDGTESPYFGICNSNGIVDSKIIDFSLKLAMKCKERLDIDQDHFESSVLRKLQYLQSRYSKDIIKAPMISARKGNITKAMNKVKEYRNTVIKGKNPND